MSKEFIWTDELVKEFTEGAIRVQNSMPHDVSLDLGLSKFKKSKLKENKIEVELREQGYGNLRHTNDKGHFYPYSIEVYSQPIPPEKYESVKKAIEDCLNEVESKPLWEMDKVAQKYAHKIFTEKELKEAFNAAKEVYQNNATGFIHYFDGDKQFYHPYRYKTWEDYIQSKK